MRAGLVERVEDCASCTRRSDPDQPGRPPCERPLVGQKGGEACYNRHRLTDAGRTAADQLERDATREPPAPKLSRAQQTTLGIVVHRGGEINGFADQPGINCNSLLVLVRLGLLERVEQCRPCHSRYNDNGGPAAPCARPLEGQPGGNECYRRHRVTRAGLAAVGTRAALNLLAQLDHADAAPAPEPHQPDTPAFTRDQRVTVDLHGNGDAVPGTVLEVARARADAGWMFYVGAAARILRCAAWQLTANTPPSAPTAASPAPGTAAAGTASPSQLEFLTDLATRPGADACDLPHWPYPAGTTAAVLDADWVTVDWGTPDRRAGDPRHFRYALTAAGRDELTRAGVVIRLVTIPATDTHEGRHVCTVALVWTCPTCGGPRGDVVPASSYHNSHRLACDGWINPCGHIDRYPDVRREAGRPA